MTTNGTDNNSPDWTIRVGGCSVTFVDFPKAALIHPKSQTGVCLVSHSIYKPLLADSLFGLKEKLI